MSPDLAAGLNEAVAVDVLQVVGLVLVVAFAWLVLAVVLGGPGRR